MTPAERLRAKVLQQSGIAIDASDPLVAVLIASAEQAEEVGDRLLRRVSVTRTVLASAGASLVLCATAVWATWQVADYRARVERAEWLRQQSDPRLASLLASDQGRAAVQLAELGVARMLLNCTGRTSWHIASGYCIPMTAEGRPDGFDITRRVKVVK